MTLLSVDNSSSSTGPIRKLPLPLINPASKARTPWGSRSAWAISSLQAIAKLMVSSFIAFRLSFSTIIRGGTFGKDKRFENENKVVP